jgi:hypothetical protein
MEILKGERKSLLLVQHANATGDKTLVGFAEPEFSQKRICGPFGRKKKSGPAPNSEPARKVIETGSAIVGR